MQYLGLMNAHGYVARCKLQLQPQLVLVWLMFNFVCIFNKISRSPKDMILKTVQSRPDFIKLWIDFASNLLNYNTGPLIAVPCFRVPGVLWVQIRLMDPRVRRRHSMKCECILICQPALVRFKWSSQDLRVCTSTAETVWEKLMLVL
jgi:hypothetical protein